MRRIILWAVVVAGTALVQTTWLDAIRVWGALPDATLLLVVFFALSDGEEWAMATGVLGGLFQDVAGNVTLGHHVLCHVVLGYAVGRMATRLITDHPAVKTTIVLGAALIHGLLYTVILYIQTPDTTAMHHIVVTVVPNAFYTALCTPLVFLLLDLGFRRSPANVQGSTVMKGESGL
ncbi:MAG: rod shape-determining protein MreD [bacterium]|nr:rod shape-determining protein MreD [bacterium]